MRVYHVFLYPDPDQRFLERIRIRNTAFLTINIWKMSIGLWRKAGFNFDFDNISTTTPK